MRAAINILLVVIVGLVVSARGLQSNLDGDSYTYDPDSIADNERILRLFIRLASETANHLIRLKKTTKPPADVRPNNVPGTPAVSSNGPKEPGNPSETIKDSATQPVEIGMRMMIDPGKNDTSQLPAKTNNSSTPILPSQQSKPGLAPQGAGIARKVDVVAASTGESRLASQSGQSESKNQSRQSGNPTERMVYPANASGPGINQVPAGQLSSHSTAQPVGLKIQSESKSQTGNETGGMVHQARRPESNRRSPGSVIGPWGLRGPPLEPSSLPIAQGAGSKNLTNGMIAPMAGNPTEQSGNVKIPGQLDPNRLVTFGSSLGSFSVPVNSELRRILGPLGVPINPASALRSIFNPASVPVNSSGNLGRILGPVAALMNPASALGSSLNPSSAPVNRNSELGQIFGPVGVPMNPGAALGSIPNPINVPVNPITDLGRILGPVGVPTNPVTIPVNSGASSIPNQAIHAIADAGNGTPVNLMHFGQDSGPKGLGDVHDKATSLVRGLTGQSGQSLSGLIDVGAKSGQPISEKGNRILSSASMVPNDGGISGLNSKLKGASPLFRSLPDVEATSRAIEHDLESTKEHVQTVLKAPFKSEERPSLLKDKVNDNAGENRVSELELQDFAIKFADALRPLGSGWKVPGSPGSKEPMGNGTDTPKTMV